MACGRDTGKSMHKASLSTQRFYKELPTPKPAVGYTCSLSTAHGMQEAASVGSMHTNLLNHSLQN